MVATTLVLIFGAVYFIWYWVAFNSLIAAKNATEQSWSNIEVDLARRLDLIGNLVEVVKGYAGHEKSTFERVVAARGAAGSHDPAGAARGQSEMTRAATSLFAIAEAYPDLKADANFRALHEELVETENRIAERRNVYNQTVTLFKNLCEIFPSVVVAKVHNFKPQGFFDIPDDLVRSAPTVSL